MNVPKLSLGARQLKWMSCLTLAGKLTLAHGTTLLLHINTLCLVNQDNSWRCECHKMPSLRA